MTNPTPLAAEGRALLEKATINLEQLSGEACEHGWDRHVCPIRGCGPDVEDARDRLISMVPALLRAQEQLERAVEVLVDALAFIRGDISGTSQRAGILREGHAVLTSLATLEDK